MRTRRVDSRDGRRFPFGSATSPCQHRFCPSLRRLRLEPLEDRRLLSTGPFPLPLQAFVGGSGHRDSFPLDLDEGQSITIVAEPDATSRPIIEVLDPNGLSMGTAASESPGADAVLQVVPVDAAGTYTVAIGGASGTAGGCRVRPLLNAAAEGELYDGPNNDEPAAAQDLDASFIRLADAARRGAVLGKTGASDDWYSFTLGDGQSATVALTALSGGNLALELYDADSNCLAVGTVAANVDQAINNFVDPTTEGGADTYFVKVMGDSSTVYTLIVTRDADFQTALNAAPANVQEIMPGDTVLLGHSQSSPNNYAVSVQAGDVLQISTATPAGGPGEFVNDLDPIVELYNPESTLVATDDNGAPDGRNALLTHTAAMTGIYTVSVLANAAVGGEYVLRVTGSTGTLPTFEVVATDPADAAGLTEPPTHLTVHFSGNVLWSTLDSADLTVNGVGFGDVQFLDGNTAVFDLSGIVGEGLNQVRGPGKHSRSAGHSDRSLRIVISG